MRTVTAAQCMGPRLTETRSTGAIQCGPHVDGPVEFPWSVAGIEAGVVAAGAQAAAGGAWVTHVPRQVQATNEDVRLLERRHVKLLPQ